MKFTGDAEILTGDPRWQSSFTGAPPLAYSFTGVEAGEAVGRDVSNITRRFSTDAYFIS